MFQSEAQYNEQLNDLFATDHDRLAEAFADPDHYANNPCPEGSHREYDACINDAPLSPLETYYLTELDHLNQSNRAGLADWAAELQADLLDPRHADKRNVTARLIELARHRYQTGQTLYETNRCSRCGGAKGVFASFSPNLGRCFRCNDTGVEPKVQLA